MSNPKIETNAEIQMRASMLKHLVSAFKSIGFTHSGGVLVEFYKAGIILRMESQAEILGIVAISKRALPSYSCKVGYKTVLNFDTITTMKGWSEGKKESIPLLLKFTEANITMKYENLNQRTKHQYFEDVATSVELLTKGADENIDALNELGTLNSEALTFIIDRISRQKADEYSPDYSEITSNGKILKYSRVLSDSGDTVEAELESTKKTKARKKADRSLFETKTLSDIIKGFCQLTKETHVKGGTDKPLMLSGAGTTPDNMAKFETDLEYFVIIAPRVEGN